MNRATLIWLIAIIVAQVSCSQLRSKKGLSVQEALAIAEKDGIRPVTPTPAAAPLVPQVYVPQAGMIPQMYAPGAVPPGYPQYRPLTPMDFAEPAAGGAQPAGSAAGSGVSGGNTAAASSNSAVATGAMQNIMDLAKTQESQHTSLMTQVQNYINSEKNLADKLASEIRQKAAALSKLITNLQGEGGQMKRTANTLAEKKEMEKQLKTQIKRIQSQIQKLEGEVNVDNEEASKDRKSEGQTEGELGSEGSNYQRMLKTKQQYENDILTLRSEYRKVQDRYKALTTIPIAEIKVDKFAMGSASEDPALRFTDANGYYPDGLKDSNTHPPEITRPPPPAEEEISPVQSGSGEAPGAAEMDEIPPQGTIQPGER